ncbi:MAG: LptF/LptG family permease [Opitutae bacterium]|nr:LptF/LptG family permease [Opitutae bacterium]
MNLLDRYIFKSVFGTCLAAVALLAFVLMVGNVLRDLLGYALAGQIDFATFARLTLLLTPFAFVFALPMGVLTGVLLTLGRLSADSEITAMRAAGLSLRRIARPVIVFGLLGFAVALYINFVGMPAARAQYNRERAAALRANPLNFVVARTFIREFPGYVLYVGEKQGSMLRDFWLWELDGQQRVVRMLRAASGRIDYDEADNELILTLMNTRVENRAARNPEDFTEPQLVPWVEKWEAGRLPLDRVFRRGGGVRTKLDWMSLGELTQARVRLQAPPAGETAEQAAVRRREITRVDFALSDRFNIALAVFSFALIGVPLGVKVSRRETSANLGVAVALALGYYFFTTVAGWFDKRPDLYPALLLLLPNLLMLALAAWLFARLERR